jgi:hypothetical protein
MRFQMIVASGFVAAWRRVFENREPGCGRASRWRLYEVVIVRSGISGPRALSGNQWAAIRPRLQLMELPWARRKPQRGVQPWKNLYRTMRQFTAIFCVADRAVLQGLA